MLLMKLVALFYVIFFKVMMVPVYVAGGINLAFVALVSLASCALDLDNSSSLLINSISLLILSVAALAFALSIFILVLPFAALAFSFYAALRDPYGKGGACKYVGF